MNGIFTYGTTFILGLIHAFEPGHGKTFLAAFSLRETNFKIFLSLILSLFISHFLMLGLFAFAIQKLASSAQVLKYNELLQWATPIIVIIYGGYLFFKAKKHHKTKSGCSCGHDHSHSDITSNTKSATITGFIAGLMPCPTAIAPLFISGLHDGFSHSLFHIFVYVSGMTIALFSFTATLLLMKRLFKKQIQKLENKINMNMLSAIVMIGIGILYLTSKILVPEHVH